MFRLKLLRRLSGLESKWQWKSWRITNEFQNHLASPIRILQDFCQNSWNNLLRLISLKEALLQRFVTRTGNIEKGMSNLNCPSILPSKYTFWGQNRLNIWNFIYIRKMNVHVFNTWYTSLHYVLLIRALI